MGPKGFLHLIILFLSLSSTFLSCTAVPSSRSFQLIKEELPAQAANLLNDQKNWVLHKFLQMEEGIKIGRIAMESIDDYGPTGPNPHHDPKPPGRV